MLNNLLDVAAPTFPEVVGDYSESIIAFVVGLLVGIGIVMLVKTIKNKKKK